MRLKYLLSTISAVILLGACALYGDCVTNDPVTRDDQRPAFLSALPFKVAACHEVDVLPTEYYPDRGFDFAYEMSTDDGLLSPSGRLFIWFRRSTIPGLQRIDVVDVRNGNRKLVAPFLQQRVSDIMGAAWDPADENFMYVTTIEREQDEGPSRVIWRIRWEGTEVTLVSPNNVNARIVSVTIDGKWLLMDVSPYPRPKVPPRSSYVWQSLEDVTKRRDANWDGFVSSLSPNMHYAAGNPPQSSNGIAFYHHNNTHAFHMFSAEQVLFHTAIGREITGYGYIKSPRWLPDSSGVLIAVAMPGEDTERTIAMYCISVDGEVKRLTTGVWPIACSQSGRHWLFEANDTWYVVSVAPPNGS